MRRTFAGVFTLLTLLIAPASLFAKGRTIKITITGGDLTAPIEATHEAVGWFGVWEGPGVSINGVPQTSGFIVDWSKGAVAERRSGLPRYEVLFYVGCMLSEWGCRASVPRLAYVLSYEYDAAAGQGYVYLPGKGDKWHRLNVSSILRGVEGNWFLATREWQKFAQPLIERAQTESRVASR